MSSPSSVIAPARARGLPQIVISSVDLPAPLAPIRVTISPLADVEVDAVQRLDGAVEGRHARTTSMGIANGSAIDGLVVGRRDRRG